MVAGGGACVVAGGMCAWFQGACVVVGGGTWLQGVCVAAGGMCGCEGCAWLQGACVVAGCVRGCWGRACVWDTTRYGQYASYWNAFLFYIFICI